MFRILVVAFISLFSLFSAQNKRFSYQYSYSLDSTSNDTESEIVRLDINEGKSIFYGEKKYLSDSLIVINTKKGIIDMTPPLESMYSDVIMKDSSKDSMKFITYLTNNKLTVNENIVFN